MRVAVIGSGISGLVCAHALHPAHEVEVFEASDWMGGHTHTVAVELDGERYPVDTGFIVYNERNYPYFSKLLAALGVETQPTEMSFGFSSERSGIEYSGSSLSGVFAQRRNLLRPRFLLMLREVLRFFREASALSLEPEKELSLGDWLDARGFSREFCDEHLLPMGAAIWSGEPERIRDFPVSTFTRFFENHGLLGLRERPRWRVVRGGSHRYVEALTKTFRERIHLEMPVTAVHRDGSGVDVETFDGAQRRFDAVAIATHSDQALAMLADPSEAEREVLGAIRYQPNEVVLHTDTSLLPRQRRARAAWNYRVPLASAQSATVTYDMSLLQGIDASERFLVTLNQSDAIDPARVLGRFEYAHPVFDAAALRAQARQPEIARDRRTTYCGAYWRYGFHEDGVRSGIRAARQIERFAS